MSVSLSPYTITVLALETSRGMSWYWLPQTITAIFSIIIAGIALWASIRTSRKMQKHNELSVTPLLRTKTNLSSENGFFNLGFEVRNIGNGPAIIKRYAVFIGDKEYVINNPSATEKIKGLMMNHGIFEPRAAAFGSESAIGKDESYVILDGKARMAEAGEKMTFGLLGFKIEYQSIYRNETFYCSISNKFGFPPKKNQKEKNRD